MVRVQIARSAETDLLEGYVFYEQQQAGIGDYFLDSLSADIAGGAAAGLATCWCNFTGAENQTKFTPTYTVADYAQLKLVAVGEEELKIAAAREKRHQV